MPYNSMVTSGMYLVCSNAGQRVLWREHCFVRNYILFVLCIFIQIAISKMEELIGNSDEEEGNILLDSNMVIVNEHDEIIGEIQSGEGPDVQAEVDNFVQSFRNGSETLPAATCPVNMEVDQTVQVQLPLESDAEDPPGDPPAQPEPVSAPATPEPPEPLQQNFDMESDSNDDHNDNDDNNDNGYIIESEGDSDNDEYDPNASIPLINYNGDIQMEEDIINGWPEMHLDTGPTVGPFMGEATLTLDSPDKDPITYFKALFDTSMWTTLCDETNRYAHQTKLATIGIYCFRFCPIFSDFILFRF